MFTTEHEFDGTRITLVDYGDGELQEDVEILMTEDEVVVKQLQEQAGGVQEINLSRNQLKDLIAALKLPEGVYRSE